MDFLLLAQHQVLSPEPSFYYALSPKIPFPKVFWLLFCRCLWNTGNQPWFLSCHFQHCLFRLLYVHGLLQPGDSSWLPISLHFSQHWTHRLTHTEQSLNMKHTLSEQMCYVFVLSCVRLFKTLCSVAHQAPLSLGFSRQYWRGLPFPSGELPDPGIKPTSLASPGLVGRFFTTVPPGKTKQTDTVGYIYVNKIL